MSELARNLNAMTNRLEINNKLDEEVAERTQQVHQQQAWRASAFWRPEWRMRSTTRWPRSPFAQESLHERVTPLLNAEDPDHHHRHLSGMIEKEAFRCKEITRETARFLAHGRLRTSHNGCSRTSERRRRNGSARRPVQ